MENSSNIYKMIKTVTHIPVPPEWESTNDWDSHRPMLWLMCENINGGVIEFGSGLGSTHLLNDKLGGLFFSFDNNKDWCDKTGATYSSDLVAIKVNGCKDNLQCVFIDAAPAEIRKPLIENWKDTPIIVVHDAEIGSDYVYGLKGILSTFEYRLNYEPDGKPHTTVVSNFVNVTEWI